MEKKVTKLKDLALNVLLETSSLFQDACNNGSESQKLSVTLIANYFVEKYGAKELNFDLFLPLFVSDDEKKTSTTILHFFKNATQKPYGATESIILTLTKYMVATDSVANGVSALAKTAEVIRTMCTEYERVKSLHFSIDQHNTIIKLMKYMIEKKQEQQQQQQQPLFRIQKLEIVNTGTTTLTNNGFLETIKNISILFPNLIELKLICRCCSKKVTRRDSNQIFNSGHPIITILSKSTNALFNKKYLAYLKSNGIYFEIDFSSKLRNLLIPSFSELTTIIVDYNNVEEIAEISSLFNLQKIGVRLNHRHPSTVVNPVRIWLMAIKTGVETLELIFSFSSEEEIFPHHYYFFKFDRNFACANCSQRKLSKLVVVVEIENKRIIEWEISKTPPPIANYAKLSEREEREAVGDEEDEKKIGGLLRMLEINFLRLLTKDRERNEIKIPFCLVCRGTYAVVELFMPFTHERILERCPLHSGKSWRREIERKIIDSWDTKFFRNRLQRNIRKIDGSLELNFRNVCHFNAILRRNQNVDTLSPFQFQNVHALKLVFDGIMGEFERNRDCGLLSNKIIKAFPNLRELEIKLNDYLFKSIETCKMILDEENESVFKNLVELKIDFSFLLYDICRASPRLEKVVVFFNSKCIHPCRINTLLKITRSLKRGLEFNFDRYLEKKRYPSECLRVCRNPFHRGNVIHLFQNITITMTDVSGNPVIRWNLKQYVFYELPEEIEAKFFKKQLMLKDDMYFSKAKSFFRFLKKFRDPSPKTFHLAFQFIDNREFFNKLFNAIARIIKKTLK